MKTITGNQTIVYFARKRAHCSLVELDVDFHGFDDANHRWHSFPLERVLAHYSDTLQRLRLKRLTPEELPVMARLTDLMVDYTTSWTWTTPVATTRHLLKGLAERTPRLARLHIGLLHCSHWRKEDAEKGRTVEPYAGLVRLWPDLEYLDIQEVAAVGKRFTRTEPHVAAVSWPSPLLVVYHERDFRLSPDERHRRVVVRHFHRRRHTYREPPADLRPVALIGGVETTVVWPTGRKICELEREFATRWAYWQAPSNEGRRCRKKYQVEDEDIFFEGWNDDDDEGDDRSGDPAALDLLWGARFSDHQRRCQQLSDPKGAEERAKAFGPIPSMSKIITDV